MAQQKRYKLLIWFYLHNHLHKSIHAAHSMEVELTRKTKDYELHSRRPDWSLGRNGPSSTSKGSSTTLMAI